MGEGKYVSFAGYDTPSTPRPPDVSNHQENTQRILQLCRDPEKAVPPAYLLHPRIQSSVTQLPGSERRNVSKFAAKN
jgi:hypothetical protein